MGAHEFISGAMADVTPEQAGWQPPGRANPIGAQFAHVAIPAAGETTEGSMLNMAVMRTTRWRCAEICCLKGIQRGAGYPV